ncbi:DUF5702 domain-containing protein [Oceanobacillus kapialis]|uniref:DUF5702 domain-containing protein n=1 Tax=Oceanobacillus kapialis TaxID=481353 RepID=A0ABW5Q662_9BACI
MQKLKAAFHRFVIKENGAVSIYVIIVTLLLFLFNAVLIDFVRIMVAEYQVEQASKSAIRSSFSSYDKDVQNKGLFVINPGAEQPAEIFDKVFEENLTVDESGYYKFVDTKVENTSFEPNENRTFSNTEIVKHQILEDMKYKAPIEFGKVIIDGILPYTCTMQEAEVYVDVAKEVDGLVQDRDESMDDAVKHLLNARNSLKDAEGKVNDSARSTYPNVDNLEDARAQFPEYEEEPEEEFENDLRNVLVEIRTKGNTAKKELNNAVKDLEKAQRINNNIEKKIGDVKEDVNQKYNNLSSNNCSDQALTEVEGELNDLTNQISEYVIEKSFFTSSISKTKKAGKSVDGGAPGNSATLLPYVKYQISDFEGFLNGPHNAVINNIKNHFDTAYTDTKAAHNYADNNYEETETGDSGSGGSFSDALSALNKIKDIVNKGMALNTDYTTYNKLKDLVTTYGGASENSAGDLDLEDAEQGSQDSFDMIGSLFHNLGGLAKDVRDEAYINEYILTRFASDNELGLFQPSSYPDNFLFINREVEYILYGSHTPGVNYGYALLELTATRFAFNFIASFTQTEVKAVPHPLPKFIAATVWAFNRTVKDIEKLTSGEEVPLLHIDRMRPFMTDYKFYLRLFLFMHPGGDSRINRIQAVVDNKTTQDIVEAPTYVSAKAEASIDLWFLPGVMDMLGSTGILEGSVRNGRYYIEKEVDYSY